MVAWAETMVRGAGAGSGATSEGSSSSGGSSEAAPPQQQQPLRMGIDGSGRLVAGVATFDAAQRLFATEEAVEELLRRGSGGGGEGGAMRLSTRLKNFSLPALPS